jgi:hypothetical protein
LPICSFLAVTTLLLQHCRAAAGRKSWQAARMSGVAETRLLKRFVDTVAVFGWRNNVSDHAEGWGALSGACPIRKVGGDSAVTAAAYKAHPASVCHWAASAPFFVLLSSINIEGILREVQGGQI